LNEFVFYIHELAGTSKKIFLKKKMLPDCNADTGSFKADISPSIARTTAGWSRRPAPCPAGRPGRASNPPPQSNPSVIGGKIS
jgi:hypothetical protein